MISRREMFAGFAVVPFAAALEITGGDSAPVTAAVEPKRRFAQKTGREMLRERYFPNTKLTTSDGRKVRFYDDLLKDKIVILNLMYAQCEGICSAATVNLKHVRQLLRAQVNHDIFIYSLTLKPEEDSPTALKEYAEMHGVDTDPHWLFLTGKPEEVDLLRHKLGFADPDPEIDRDKSRHSGMLRYGNEPQCIWGSCQGSAEADWIAQEIGFAIPRAMKRSPAVNE